MSLLIKVEHSALFGCLGLRLKSKHSARNGKLKLQKRFQSSTLPLAKVLADCRAEAFDAVVGPSASSIGYFLPDVTKNDAEFSAVQNGLCHLQGINERVYGFCPLHMPPACVDQLCSQIKTAREAKFLPWLVDIRERPGVDTTLENICQVASKLAVDKVLVICHEGRGIDDAKEGAALNLSRKLGGIPVGVFLLPYRLPNYIDLIRHIEEGVTVWEHVFRAQPVGSLSA